MLTAQEGYEMLTPQEANKRVALGIETLNKRWKRKQPWLDIVDLSTFNMQYWENCILGQLYGDYWLAVEKKQWSNYAERIEQGFTLPGEGETLDYEGGSSDLSTDPEMAILTRAWKRAILKLRAAAGK